MGNLLNRVLVLLKKEGGALAIPDSDEDAKRMTAEWKAYAERMDSFDLHGAIQGVMKLVDDLNKDIDAAKPWKQEGEAKVKTLSTFAESLRHVTLMLLPFVPETAQKIAHQLALPNGDELEMRDFVIKAPVKKWGGEKGWKKVGEPEILFKQVI